MMCTVFHTGPVTALASLGGAILAGIGSRLHVYRIHPTVQLVSTYRILPGRVVHGVKQEPCNNSEGSRLCVFGQKCLRVVHFDVSLEIKVNTDIVEFDDWLWDVAWLQGEERLALALAHNVIVVWDINTGTVTQTTHCAEKCILYCAKFLTHSKADLVLAAGTVFNQVVLWSPNNKPDDNGLIVPFHRLAGHQGVIFSIDYHPVLQRICSVSDDRSLRLYQVTFPHTDNDYSFSSWENMETSLIHVLYGHSARVWDVRLMSKVVVSIGEDATCCVWSYNGNVVQKFKGHKGKSIWSMAVDTEENFVVTGGGDSSIRLWNLRPGDTETHTSTYHLDLQITAADFPRSVQFLSDHLVLVMTNQGWLLLTDTGSNTLTYKMKDDVFASYSIMSVSPQKHKVAIGNIQGLLRIMSWNGGIQQEPEISDTMLYSGRITSIIWLDNQHILTSGPDGKMNIWRLSDNGADCYLQMLASFELPESKHRWASAAIFSRDMTHLICGDKTGSVMLYNIDGRLVQMFPKIHKPEVTYVCLHGNQVYTAGRDGIYRLYDWGEDQLILLNSSKVFKGFVWIERLTITEDGDMLIQGFNANKFIVWSVDQNQKLIEVESGGGHRSWDFLLTGCHGNKTRLLYIKAREVIVKEIQIQSHQLIVKGCLHGREVCDIKHITSSYDSSGKPVHLLATCSEDTMVCLPVISYTCNEHNQQDMHILHTLSGHISSVRCLCLCESSVPSSHNSKLYRKLLFSAGGRAQIKIWRLNIECNGHLNQFRRPNSSKDTIGLSKSSDICQKSETINQIDVTQSSVISHSSDSSLQNSSESLKHDNLESPSTSSKDMRNDHIHDSTDFGNKHHGHNAGSTSELDITCQYESIAGVLLGSHKKRKGRPWKVREDNSDQETRILDMAVFKATEISALYPESLYFLTVACSDGLIRFFFFEEDSREITFIASSNFHNHCILKVTHVIHKSDHVTSALVLSAATDGKVAFWDMTDMCKSVVNDVTRDRTAKTGYKINDSGTNVFLENRMQAQHTLASKNFSSGSKSFVTEAGEMVDGVDEDNAVDAVCNKEDQMSDLVPVGWLDCHQSGVNSIYFGTYTSPDTYILITGGDDNAVHINLITLDELVTKDTDSPGQVKVISSGREVGAHVAQITGVWYLGSNLMVTASIDQRVCVWAFTVQDSNIKLQLKGCKFIDVPDIANIDVWEHGDTIYLAACGEALELIEIRIDNMGGTL